VSLDVRPVRTRRDLRRFIKLPWRLYSTGSPWVAPLLSERRSHLDRGRNPFFEHAEAEYFLASRDGVPVGRITAHIDFRLNEVQQNTWGLFGFLECENRPETAAALLSTAEQWLRARGCDRMVGPMDFTLNHECGLLVEGHDRAPQILENWHHPYYAALVEGAGLTKVMDLVKYELFLHEVSDMLPVFFELAGRLEPEHGVTLRHMRKRDIGAEIRRFSEVYHSAWERNWGFVPFTDREIGYHAKELKPILDENWAVICEKDGEPVGVALAIPDYNEVLAKLDGRLLPFGWVSALRDRRKIRSVRVWALGVKPEYQHLGVAAGLYVEYLRVAKRTRVTRGEMGWILETNEAMNRGMEAMNGRVVKRYRLYERSFDTAPETSAAAGRVGAA